MIHEYDFSSVFNEAVTEEQARQIKWQSEYKPTVQELLKKLQEALKEEAQVQEMWPEAKMKDKEMFTHLNFEFDLNGGRIIAETAAKDYHGVPLYEHVYDLREKPAAIALEEEEVIAEVDAKPAES